MRKALVLINPGARMAAQAETALKALEMTDLTVIPARENDPHHFPRLIRRFQDRIDLVVIGGGDGTIRSVLDTVRETRIPMGILPLGTANNLARTLGIPTDLTEASRIVAHGKIESIDLGLANGVPFLNVVGLGLSTQVNRLVSHEMKRRWGPLAYAVSCFKIARRTGRFSAQIRCGDQEFRVRSLQISVCNGRHYGAGFTVSDDATITDGLLHLISTEVETWWQGLRLLPKMLHGQYDPWQGIRLLKGPEIEITTRRPMSIDTDGEITTRTPALIRVLPKALQVAVPNVNEAQTSPGLAVPTGTEPDSAATPPATQILAP